MQGADSAANVVTFTTKTTISMKEDNKDHPYVVDKTVSRHAFALRYAKLETVMSLLRELHAVLQGGGAAWQKNDELEAYIARRQESKTFDSTCLEDLTEVTAFEAKVQRITPLVSNAGRSAHACLHKPHRGILRSLSQERAQRRFASFCRQCPTQLPCGG